MKLFYCSYWFGSYEIFCIADSEEKGKKEVLRILNKSFGARFRLRDIDEDIQVTEERLNRGGIK